MLVVISFGGYDGKRQVKLLTLYLLSHVRLNNSNNFQHPEVLFALTALNSVVKDEEAGNVLELAISNCYYTHCMKYLNSDSPVESRSMIHNGL